MASYPNFDPNDFTNGIRPKTFSRYLNDALHPLYNRAIAAATPSGSTFKMVTGSGAISSRVIGNNQVLYDSGAWNCHGHTFRDIASGGLGTTNFIHALAASSRTVTSISSATGSVTHALTPLRARIRTQ